MYIVRKNQETRKKKYRLNVLTIFLLLLSGFGLYLFDYKIVGLVLMALSFINSLLIPKLYSNIKIYRKTKMLYDDGFSKFEPVNFAEIKNYKIVEKGKKKIVKLYKENNKKMFEFSLEDDNGIRLLGEIEKYCKKKNRIIVG